MSPLSRLSLKSETCSDCQHTTCGSLNGSDSVRCPLSASHLCDACTKLVDLDKRMRELHRQLADLARERVQVKFAANKRHDQLIHRMPPEIASHIFSLYVEDRTKSNPKSSDKDNWVPSLLIASICKTWRDVALSTPQLWSSPNFSLKYPTTEIRWRAELAKPCLQRSGALPLQISLYMDEHSFDNYQQEYQLEGPPADFEPLLNSERNFLKCKIAMILD